MQLRESFYFWIHSIRCCFSPIIVSVHRAIILAKSCRMAVTTDSCELTASNSLARQPYRRDDAAYPRKRAVTCS